MPKYGEKAGRVWKVCKICGERFYGTKSQLYCTAQCRKKAVRERDKMRRPGKLKPNMVDANGLDWSNLREVANAAMAAGMTYGKFVAKFEARRMR